MQEGSCKRLPNSLATGRTKAGQLGSGHKQGLISQGDLHAS